MKRQNPYHAYLLRCWQESDQAATWRFSLEGVHDHQRHGFADLESLLAFLQQLTETNRDSAVRHVSSRTLSNK